MKTKIVLIAKLAIIILLSGILLILINNAYVKGYYYSNVYGEVQKFRNVPEHLKFVNFGTSHGVAAFRYPVEEKEYTFNFALSSEDLYHNFQTLKQFSDYLEQGCIVTIPVSYFQFCQATDEPSQKRYYCYLDKEYLIDFSYETWINAKYMPVLRSAEFLFKDIIKDQQLDIERFMDEVDNAEENTAEPQGGIEAYNAEHERELESHAVIRATGWMAGRMVVGKKYIDENKRILTDMIVFCREKGFEPILITAPVFHSLRDAFSEDDLNYYYYDNILDIADKTDVLYIDYTNDERFIYDESFYTNSDHMSAAGAESFYKAYRKDLISSGYELNNKTI